MMSAYTQLVVSRSDNKLLTPSIMPEQLSVLTARIEHVVGVPSIKYRKILKIRPGLIEVRKQFLAGISKYRGSLYGLSMSNL